MGPILPEECSIYFLRIPVNNLPRTSGVQFPGILEKPIHPMLYPLPESFFTARHENIIEHWIILEEIEDVDKVNICRPSFGIGTYLVLENMVLTQKIDDGHDPVASRQGRTSMGSIRCIHA